MSVYGTPGVAVVHLATYCRSPLDLDRRLNIQNFNSDIDHCWEGARRNVISARASANVECVTNISRRDQRGPLKRSESLGRVIIDPRPRVEVLGCTNLERNPSRTASGDLQWVFDRRPKSQSRRQPRKPVESARTPLKAHESPKAIKVIVGFLMYPSNCEASLVYRGSHQNYQCVVHLRCKGRYGGPTTNLYTTKREDAPEAKGRLPNLGTQVEVKDSEGEATVESTGKSEWQFRKKPTRIQRKWEEVSLVESSPVR